MDDQHALANLEIVMFELDLNAADIIGDGFEVAVVSALEKIGGSSLSTAELMTIRITSDAQRW